MPVQEGRGIAVMSGQNNISVDSFLEIFAVVHFIRDDLRQEFRDDQMAGNGIVKINGLQKLLQRQGILTGLKIIFIKNLIFVQIQRPGDIFKITLCIGSFLFL